MSNDSGKPRNDDDVLRIGRQMSNVLFNLAQRGDGASNIHLSADEYRLFAPLYKQWDEAVAKYRASFKRKRAKR